MNVGMKKWHCAGAVLPENVLSLTSSSYVIINTNIIADHNYSSGSYGWLAQGFLPFSTLIFVHINNNDFKQKETVIVLRYLMNCASNTSKLKSSIQWKNLKRFEQLLISLFSNCYFCYEDYCTLMTYTRRMHYSYRDLNLS